MEKSEPEKLLQVFYYDTSRLIDTTQYNIIRRIRLGQSVKTGKPGLDDKERLWRLQGWIKRVLPGLS